MRNALGLIEGCFVVGALAVACGGASMSDLLQDGGPLPDAPSVDAPLANDTGTGGADVSTGPGHPGHDASTNPGMGSDAGGGPEIGVGESGAESGFEGGMSEGGPLTFACGGKTESDCAGCGGSPQACVFCSRTSSMLTGVCTALHANCVTALPTGYGDCACGSASDCPESDQVCTPGGRCHTCTDATANDGLMCQGGGTCSAAKGCL